MKSLVESIFSKDLIEKDVYSAFETWLNTDDHDAGLLISNKYMEIIKYITSYNPKCSDSISWNYTDKFLKNLNMPIGLEELAKSLKKIFIKYQKATPTNVIFIDSWKNDDLKEDGDPNGIDDLSNDIEIGIWKSKDGVYRFKKLKKEWIDAILQYNEYYDLPMIDTNCKSYIALSAEEYFYIIGFPKGMPDEILKVFHTL